MPLHMNTPVTLNEAAVAALYSPFAGVLAGFAFAGVLLIATERISTPGNSSFSSSSPHTRESSLVLLLAAFLGLCINSLTYAIIGGEMEPYKRAAVMHVLAGGGFAVSALALLFAIYVLIHDIASGLSSWIRFAVGICAPFVFSIYVTAGVTQAQQMIDPVDSKLLVITWISVAMAHIISAIMANRRQGCVFSLQQTKLFASFSVGMAFASSIGVAALQTMGGAHITTWPAWAGFFAVLIVMMAFTFKVGAKP